MNSIPLHEFFSENVVVDCGKFVYIALISKLSMKTLSLRPIQQTDAEQYGTDSRVLYLQRNSMHNNLPMVSYGHMHDSIRGVDNYHRDDSHAYQQAVQTTTWTTGWGQPIENTPEQEEREYGLFCRIYNRVLSILMYEL